MLTDFGVRLMGRMTEPTTLALARVVIAAAEKFPNVGRAFYEAARSTAQPASQFARP